MINDKSLINLLFESVDLGKIQLKNRLVMAPMTRCHSPGYTADIKSIEYYAARVRGGIGLIISEGTPVNDSGHGYKDVPSFYGEGSLAGWKKILNAVHEEGGKMFPQLWHVGSVRRPEQGPNPHAPSFAPSAITHPYLIQQGPDEYGSPLPPVEMTQSDINTTIDDYARAAFNAQKIGFDGVEIHGAHSYLIDQFFWSVTNKRKDKYGGRSLSDRTRFAEELIKEVRQKVGPQFPLCMRISLWKQSEYEAQEADNPEELSKFLSKLADAGIDIFHCSALQYNKPVFANSDLSFAGWVKKLSGLPTIAVGCVGQITPFRGASKVEYTDNLNLEDLLRRLQKKEFDLVAVGRALLSEPDWALKVQTQRFDDIIKFDLKYLPY
jgi:2,4-dienoyl-CoA reductase-like NADH-dependent reductase (Old Yellow Enzyme family)